MHSIQSQKCLRKAGLLLLPVILSVLVFCGCNGTAEASYPVTLTETDGRTGNVLDERVYTCKSVAEAERTLQNLTAGDETRPLLRSASLEENDGIFYRSITLEMSADAGIPSDRTYTVTVGFPCTVTRTANAVSSADCTMVTVHLIPGIVSNAEAEETHTGMLFGIAGSMFLAAGVLILLVRRMRPNG